MRRPRATALLALILAWGASHPRAATADDGLSIRIVPGGTAESPVIDFDEPFQVVLTNTSDQPIRIWDPYTRNGNDQLSFRWVNLRTGTEYSSRKKEMDDGNDWVFIEDDSRLVEIAPADEFAFHVYFDREDWYESAQTWFPVWTGLPAPNSSDHFSISVEFESSVTSPDAGFPVWIGRIGSEPVSVEFIAEDIRTPHQYLRNGFSARALEIMQANPTWIGRRGEHSLTPLHIAVRFGHVDVIKWLLNNGADVNGSTRGGSTSLHLADHPEVVALLLEHEPDLSIRDGFYDRTALQTAAANLVDPSRERERSSWQAIVDLYMDAGADYDVFTAIHLDDLERVREILSQSPDLADDFQDYSPLRTAASLGRLEICRYLVEEHQVDIDDFERGVGYPIIIEAVAFPDIVRLLIENGVDLETRITWRGDRSGYWIIGDDASSLHFAARDGVPESIDLLIDHGVNIFGMARDISSDTPDQTALEVAAAFGNADNAIAMLKRPEFGEADESYRQALLNTCLSIAAPQTRPIDNAELVELVTALLEAGADPDTKDNVYRATPMRIAARRIHPDSEAENRHIQQTVEMLIEHGATLDLFTAVAIGDAHEVTRLLGEDPESPDARGPLGYPALHFAVRMNDANIVRLLLKGGADVDIRNADNGTGYADQTALHCVAFSGHEEIARLLIEAGADVNAVTERQSTPLHSAARMSNVAVARLLLENGAQIDARDENGETPLDWCERLNRDNTDEIHELFREYGQGID